jgi:ferritin-like metal-binding protein YciE
MSDDQSSVGGAKLAQYLNEAYVKERELESALQAHVEMTSRAPYRKRLQQHLNETKDHGRQVERRIKAITGHGPGTVERIAGQAIGQAKSLAKAPLHMVRGTSDAEKMLKNAKTEYWSEHEEIATYTAIEALAEEVGDKDTAKVARGIRREEERMANFLERQIPTLTRAVVREEVPASERRGSSGRSRRRTSTSRRSARRRPSSSRSSGTRRRTAGARS